MSKILRFLFLYVSLNFSKLISWLEATSTGCLVHPCISVCMCGSCGAELSTYCSSGVVCWVEQKKIIRDKPRAEANNPASLAILYANKSIEKQWIWQRPFYITPLSSFPNTCIWIRNAHTGVPNKTSVSQNLKNIHDLLIDDRKGTVIENTDFKYWSNRSSFMGKLVYVIHCTKR